MLMNNQVKLRKSETSLSPQERSQFVNALKNMKASGRYDYFVQVHYEAMSMTGMNHSSMDHSMMAHAGPLFLPWHRHYILLFERELGVPLPFWDWSINSPSIWAQDFMGGDGDQRGVVMSGPFAINNGWRCNVGIPDAQPGPELRRFLRGRQTPNVTDDRLPTRQQIDEALASPSYDQFRVRVEDIHNIVHSWVGGSMSGSASPNDPVFWLNHAFVDYLWARWQAMHPNVPHFTPSHMVASPIDFKGKLPTVTIAQTLDLNYLGYTYEGFGFPQTRTLPQTSHLPGTAMPPQFSGQPKPRDPMKPMKPMELVSNIYRLPPFKYNERHPELIENKPCSLLKTSVCQCKQRQAILQEKMKKRGISGNPPTPYVPPTLNQLPQQMHSQQNALPFTQPQMYSQPTYPQPQHHQQGYINQPSNMPHPYSTPLQNPQMLPYQYPSTKVKKPRDPMKPMKPVDQVTNIYNLPPYKYNDRHTEMIEIKPCPVLKTGVCQCKQRQAIVQEKLRKRGMSGPPVNPYLQTNLPVNQTYQNTQLPYQTVASASSQLPYQSSGASLYPF